MNVSPQLPDVNRRFLRGIFWLLVFLFLATVFSSARAVYDIFYRKAEVRKSIELVGSKIEMGDQRWARYISLVTNRGNDDAKNLHLTIRIPQGVIGRALVESDEEADISKYSADRRIVTIAAARLAPNAEIATYLWLREPLDFDASQIRFTVAFDGGVAELKGQPTTLGEVENLGQTLKRGTENLWARLRVRIFQSPQTQAMTNDLPELGIYDIGKIPYEDNQWREALIAILMIAIAAWLMLPRAYSAIVTALLVGLSFWLFTDITANIMWLGIISLLAFVVVVTSRSCLEQLVLTVCIIASFTVLYMNMPAEGLSCIASAGYSIPERIFCPKVSVPAGLVIGYGLFVVYLAFAELGYASSPRLRRSPTANQ